MCFWTEGHDNTVLKGINKKYKNVENFTIRKKET